MRPTIVHTDEVPEEESAYPPPFDGEKLSFSRRLARGRALGAWHERLPPGRRTSFTHAHVLEEEVAFVLEGTPSVRWVVPGEAPVEEQLRRGSTVTFEAGTGLAHTFVNHGPGDAVLIVVGERHAGERAWYAEDPEYQAWIAKERPHFRFDPAERGRPPAYRIETGRLTLRPWRPDDAAVLREVVRRNREHLSPFMPWARELLSLDDQVALLRSFRARYDRDEDYVLGAFLHGKVPIGGTGLHLRVGPGGAEIGYWVDAEHEGRGYVTEWVAALSRVALEAMDLDRVEIHCAPENTRSAAVAERLGFTMEAVLSRRLDGRDHMIWTLFREDLASSPAASAEVRAFDALGRRLL